MANHEQRGPRNTSMASVETHVNPTQRPTIMIDMEFALLSMIKKSNNIGSVTTKGTLKKVGVGIINKLRALNILLKIPIPIFLSLSAQYAKLQSGLILIIF